MNNLALNLHDLGERDEAIGLLRECLGYRNRAQMEGDHAIVASILATSLNYRGDLTEAEALLRTELGRAEERFGPVHQTTDRIRGNLARILIDLGRPDEAIAIAEKVVGDRRRVDPKGRAVGQALMDLGRGLAVRGEWKAAEEALVECRAIFAATTPREPFFTPWADYWYGIALAGQKRHAEAEDILTAAEAALRANPTTPKGYHRIAVERLGEFYEGWGKAEKAAEWRKRLSELTPLRSAER